MHKSILPPMHTQCTCCAISAKHPTSLFAGSRHIELVCGLYQQLYKATERLDGALCPRTRHMLIACASHIHSFPRQTNTVRLITRCTAEAHPTAAHPFSANVGACCKDTVTLDSHSGGPDLVLAFACTFLAHFYLLIGRQDVQERVGCLMSLNKVAADFRRLEH